MFKSIINLALISLVCSAPTLVKRSGSLLDLDADLDLGILNDRYGKGGLLNLGANLDLDILGGSRYGGYNPYGGYRPPQPRY